jgi:hypothetical protein
MSGPLVHEITIANETVELDPIAFDNNIGSKGLRMVHYRSMRSPVGLKDEYDIRRPGADNSGSSNGMLYRKGGEVTVLFTGNGKSHQQKEFSDMDGASVQITLPRHYDGTKTPIRLAHYDRFYLAEDIDPVPNWQLFTTSEIGLDRLTYPVAEVELIIDSDGNEYGSEDVQLWNGQIKWGSNRPPPGTVCSIRYLYRPYWYVSRILHEVRVAVKTNPETGEKKVVRMPQAVVLEREYLFMNERRDDSLPDSPRQVRQSSDGGFGPR